MKKFCRLLFLQNKLHHRGFTRSPKYALTNSIRKLTFNQYNTTLTNFETWKFIASRKLTEMLYSTSSLILSSLDKNQRCEKKLESTPNMTNFRFWLCICLLNALQETLINTYMHWRRYDTIKIVNEFSLNFPKLLIIGKYVKIGFKKRGSPYYFFSSRSRKIKNITNIEQKRLFLFTFLVSLFTAFLTRTLIYTINLI